MWKQWMKSLSLLIMVENLIHRKTKKKKDSENVRGVFGTSWQKSTIRNHNLRKCFSMQSNDWPFCFSFLQRQLGIWLLYSCKLEPCNFNDFPF